MKPDPAETVRLWRAGNDTLAIAEALVGTRQEPERAARLARNLESEVARLVATYQNRRRELRERTAVVEARRPSKELGLRSVSVRGVSLSARGLS